MDQKTLDWMNERTEKGNAIQARIKFLKIEMEKVKVSEAACIGFYDRDSSNWSNSTGYSGYSYTYRQFIYNAIAEPLVAALEKEIAELEAEFAAL